MLVCGTAPEGPAVVRPGVLTYSRIRNLETGEQQRFTVIVTDVGDIRQQVKITQFNGMVVYQQDVPTGGIVGIRTVACDDLTCSGLSDVKQSVPGLGRKARWEWNLVAGAPGLGLITLRVDTYDMGSTQTLSEELIDIPIKVTPTPAFNDNQRRAKIAGTTRSAIGYIETIGSVAAAVVSVGGLVGWIVMKRRERKVEAFKSSKVLRPPGNNRRKKASRKRRR
jgi:hypothetical protein